MDWASSHYFVSAFAARNWDSSKEPPVKQKAGGEAWAESGRGRKGPAIVETLALHVGHFFPQTGGKVVWAELALPGVVQPLLRRTPKDLSNVVLLPRATKKTPRRSLGWVSIPLLHVPAYMSPRARAGDLICGGSRMRTRQSPAPGFPVRAGLVGLGDPVPAR